MRRRRPPPSDFPAVEYLPPELEVIPYSPEPPDDEHIRTALYLNHGNVLLAANSLEMPPGRLARQIELTPSLKADREAARRSIVDLAEANIVERLLDDTNIDRRDATADFVLTSLGRSLGWGTSGQTQAAGFSLSDGSGRQLTVRWQTEE